MPAVLLLHHVSQVVSLAKQLIYSSVAVEWQEGFPAVYAEESLKEGVYL